jgi:predicted membrane channel-forming protein YqfA (hemolysin III family)
MNAYNTLVWIAIVALVNAAATAQILRNFSKLARWQGWCLIALIWAIPFIGMLISLVVLRRLNDERPPPSSQQESWPSDDGSPL